MVLNRLQLILGLSILTALMVILAFQRSQLRMLREQISRHEKGDQLASVEPRSKGGKFRLPAPSMQHEPDLPTQTQDTKAAELYAQFHLPTFSLEQAEEFLAENQRSAASLVAAFRTSGDDRYLLEAMHTFPNDPQVAFEAFFKADLLPEERRKWADALKQAAPDNPLANYLSAQDYFRSGQTDLAVRELETALGKPKFNDFTLERMQFNEEAYRASGFSEPESRSTAMFQLPLPLLKEMRSLTENTLELSKSYRQAGDTDSADAAVLIAMNLGDQFRNGGNALLVHQLLGIEINQSALRTLDPEAPFGPDGRTPQEHLNALNADQAALSSLVRATVPLQDRMTPKDWIGYIDRMRLLGEPNAMRWLQSKYGP